MNPFIFFEAVSYNKKNLIRDGDAPEGEYNRFIINRAFSYHPDTVLYASVLNQYPDLDSLMQFEFYLHSIRPSKRYAKWHKQVEDEDLEIVMKCLGLSRQKAKDTLNVLTKDNIIDMRNLLKQEGIGSEAE